MNMKMSAEFIPKIRPLKEQDKNVLYRSIKRSFKDRVKEAEDFDNELLQSSTPNREKAMISPPSELSSTEDLIKREKLRQRVSRAERKSVQRLRDRRETSLKHFILALKDRIYQQAKIDREKRKFK